MYEGPNVRPRFYFKMGNRDFDPDDYMCDSNNFLIGHVMSIVVAFTVGTQNMQKLQNSWGNEWVDNGFMLMLRHEDFGILLINLAVGYPILRGPFTEGNM